MRAPLHSKFVLALFVAGLFAASPVLAEKPDWVGNGKPGKNAQDQRDEGPRSDDRRDGGSDVRVSVHFGDRDRAVVREYYEDSFKHGRCPPGLAKKHNGCMPPGQAKKWQMGRPLPRDVIYYDLPHRVAVSLGRPPSGHKYVRVASDILLIAIGTGMVVDAIEDLGRM
jgi:Ni/Co efflux regulator RcnB